ncbi:MAG: hypothetical protein EPO11_03195 [Gammaproteobacteria bacterium]|nr:MAG: hypothetical protein EPO11_03195 [Gammaproteobacteria bacterium]
MKNLLRTILLFLWPLFVWADGGVGQVAQNAIEPVSVFASFIQTACIIVGASFLFTCLIKYIEHRRSPLMVPLSRVIFLLVAGVILILLPFISMLAGSGASDVS